MQKTDGCQLTLASVVFRLSRCNRIKKLSAFHFISQMGKIKEWSLTNYLTKMNFIRRKLWRYSEQNIVVCRFLSSSNFWKQPVRSNQLREACFCVERCVRVYSELWMSVHGQVQFVTVWLRFPSVTPSISPNLTLLEVRSVTVGWRLTLAPSLLPALGSSHAAVIGSRTTGPFLSVVLLWQGAEDQRFFKRFTWRDREEQATGNWGEEGVWARQARLGKNGLQFNIPLKAMKRSGLWENWVLYQHLVYDDRVFYYGNFFWLWFSGFSILRW